MLDPNSVLPLYYQLKEILKDKIKGNSWVEGQKVPSERELMEMYDVSRATVRKALQELIGEGLIFRKQGIGTFVSRSKVVENLTRELSFNQQAKNQGMNPSSKVVYAAIETTPPERLADIFKMNVKEKENLIKVIRVRYVNNESFMVETLYLPQRYAPNILSQNLNEIAVFDYLKDECKMNFTHATLVVESVLINEFDAQYLESDLHTPAISLQRVVYNDETAVIVQERVIRGDRGKLTLSFGVTTEKEEYIGLAINK